MVERQVVEGDGVAAEVVGGGGLGGVGDQIAVAEPDALGPSGGAGRELDADVRVQFGVAGGRAGRPGTESSATWSGTASEGTIPSGASVTTTVRRAGSRSAGFTSSSAAAVGTNATSTAAAVRTCARPSALISGLTSTTVFPLRAVP